MNASLSSTTRRTASSTDASAAAAGGGGGGSTPCGGSLTALRPEVQALKQKLDDFVESKCIPAEKSFAAYMKGEAGESRWSSIPPCVEELQKEAKRLGLWNLFIPPRLLSTLPAAARAEKLVPPLALTYREYGILCESMGRVPELAPQACNCSAPDTGNMEVLMEFGTAEQKEKYLLPLLRGDIRSTFLMTEPDVASSDPTNLQTRLTKTIHNATTTDVSASSSPERVEYILSGRKWWSTGAADPRTRLAVVVAKMDYSHPSVRKQQRTTETTTKAAASSKHRRHGAHTIVLVELPHPGVKIQRALTVMGYDDAPHGHAEVELSNVHLTEQDLVLGEGSGFRVSQARLGPGRIHHCMRAVGMAARSYELMLQRSMERKAFGKFLWQHGGCQDLISNSLSDLECARLLTLSCAAALDDVGPKLARDKIASIKVTVPELTYRVVDRAVQVFGGAGLSDDYPLAKFLAGLRSLRIADGPDAVHRMTVAKIEIQKAKKQRHSRL